jgi:hypothetical protein
VRDICEHFDVLILGAGVTGLASAYFLARSGQRVCLLDDYPSPGGNHISRELNGFTFDVGSIFFFPDNPQFKMFPGSNENFVPVDLTMSRITPQGQVRPYPLSIQDEILKHPGVLLRVALSLGFSRLLSNPGANAESHAIYHIGSYLYRRSGLRNYLLRFYGIDSKQISLHFVKRRMNLADAFSVRKVAKDLLRRMKSTRGSIAVVKIRALARPIEGFAAQYDKVTNVLRAEGVEVRCSAGLKAMSKVEDGLKISTASGTLFAKRVINTLPLKMAFNLLGKSDAVQISSTKLCTLCCSFSGQRGFATVVLYNFDDGGAWKRLTMYSDYYGVRGGREFFCVEVTLRDQVPSLRVCSRISQPTPGNVGYFEAIFASRVIWIWILLIRFAICTRMSSACDLSISLRIGASRQLGGKAFLTISPIPPLQSRRHVSVLGMMSRGCHIKGRRPARSR